MNLNCQSRVLGLQSFGLNCFSDGVYSDVFIRSPGFIRGAHPKQVELTLLSFVDNKMHRWGFLGACWWHFEEELCCVFLTFIVTYF